MSTEICVGVFEPDYAVLHNLGMAHDVPKLLRAMMDALPGKHNQTELAARLSRGQKRADKVAQPQVSRWLRGQDPERHNYDRIVEVAAEMGVLRDIRSEDVAAALPSSPLKRMSKIKGYVGASSEAHYYALADEDYEEVEAPEGATDQTIALEIRGKSWGPLLESWLVFYDDVRSPITDDLIGQPCVVGLADDRILLKQIKRERDGSFSLVSNNPNEPPIKNAEIEWAAKVINIRPRR